MQNFESYQSAKHFPNLDLFRAFSIILVMLHHSPIKIEPLKNLLHNGNHGVSLFFLISGFLITTLLLREGDKGPINIKNFLLRRGLRIYPLYYTVLIIYYIGINYFEFYNPENRIAFNRFLYAHLFYFSNLLPITGPFFFSWSLATEEQFYLLFSFLIKKIKQPKLIIFLTILILIKIAFYYVFYVSYSFDKYINFIHYFLRIFQESILIGVLLALLMHQEKSFNFLKLISSKLYIPSILIICYLLFFQNIGRHSTITSQVYNLSFAIILNYSVTSKCFSNYIGNKSYKLISYIGIISYGIYLFHMPIVNILVKLKITSNFFIFQGIWLFSVVIAATLSYELFEKRFIALKKRFY